MKVEFIAIQNFRKLKCSQIDFSDKETLFVGANNSGKTSAMDALINFLSPNKKKQTDTDTGSTQNNKFHTTDFTLSNWHDINNFGQSWLTNKEQVGNDLFEWQALCPSIDVWLNVELNEVQKVTHLIPTLKWNGGALGVRLIYQPKDIEVLKSEFLVDYSAADDLLKSEQTPELILWPKSLRDFLDRKLSNHFEVKAYLLDTDKMNKNSTIPQPLMAKQEPLASYPFHGLFKVDVIEAQRGFSDPNSSHGNSNKSDGNLSAQLNQYYSKHLNPTDLPDKKDIKALEAIGSAKKSFDERLNESFKDALGEIKGLGYPGFNDPDIQLSSQVNPVDSLDHEAAVLFTVQKHGEATDLDFSLPEKYNGLGYKNLIYMVFRLIAFRDNWLRAGKVGKRRTEEDIAIEPLHLVLIEEPEAHLHAQVQQVFIRKAYDVLSKGASQNLSTQMIVSSHSSYLVHEVNFENLRYFQRIAAEGVTNIPLAKVIDLSGVFGEKGKRKTEEKQTAEFVARYLKATHCDLFFANGIILVEGAAERMLLPHFINTHFNGDKGLSSSYISILEVGGAHAHRLKPLIEALGLPTLVITDTDAAGTDKIKRQPMRGKGYISGSDTLNSWFSLKDQSLDEILDLDFKDKVKGNVRAAYQYGIQVEFSDSEDSQEAIPYTFEDAIALSNIELIKGLIKPTGMLSKMKKALELDTLDSCCAGLYKALEKDKAQMALDLLFDVEPEKLQIPQYIQEGLEWLQSELVSASSDFLPKTILPAEVGNE